MITTPNNNNVEVIEKYTMPKTPDGFTLVYKPYINDNIKEKHEDIKYTLDIDTKHNIYSIIRYGYIETINKLKNTKNKLTDTHYFNKSSNYCYTPEQIANIVILKNINDEEKNIIQFNIYDNCCIDRIYATVQRELPIQPTILYNVHPYSIIYTYWFISETKLQEYTENNIERGIITIVATLLKSKTKIDNLIDNDMNCNVLSYFIDNKFLWTY